VKFVGVICTRDIICRGAGGSGGGGGAAGVSGTVVAIADTDISNAPISVPADNNSSSAVLYATVTVIDSFGCNVNTDGVTNAESIVGIIVTDNL
jgi:hypothetical protein